MATKKSAQTTKPAKKKLSDKQKQNLAKGQKALYLKLKKKFENG